MGGIIKKIIKPIIRIIPKFISNPIVSIGVSLFLSWILRPKVPDIEDFGTNQFDDFEHRGNCFKDIVSSMEVHQ